MNGNLDPQFFKVVAVAQPSRTDELIFVTVTLQNMIGEKKSERIMFTDAISAWEFFRTQQNLLIKTKNSKFINK